MQPANLLFPFPAILFGQGISREGEIIDLGEQAGLIQKSGAWYACNEERLGQGRDKAREALLGNSALCQQLESALLANLGIERRVEVDEPIAEAA